MSTIDKEKSLKPWIVVVSIFIPVAVGILFWGPKLQLGSSFGFLPGLNALLNGSTSVVLIAGFFAIKKGNKLKHEKLMKTALGLSVLFLISYITYHVTTPSTHFGGEGSIRSIYYFILLTHIVLAVAIVPLVLITFVRALSQKFDKHRLIAKITLPLWLYVTITGVIVYLMISPYY
jgi:putative membrane protein